MMEVTRAGLAVQAIALQKRWEEAPKLPVLQHSPRPLRQFPSPVRRMAKQLNFLAGPGRRLRFEAQKTARFFQQEQVRARERE